MAKLTDITPLFPVQDMEDAKAFFCGVLGFECRAEMDGYAYLARDAVAIRLLNADPAADMTDEARQLSFYIDVEDVDGLYASLSDNLAGLPEGHVRAPFDQDYGQREFHVIYKNLLIFFGAATVKESGS